MINEGYPEYALPEDLEGLPDEKLVEIAEICEVTTAAPDECIPCQAYATYMERRAAEKARLEVMAPPSMTEEHPDLTEEQVDEFDPEGSDYDKVDTPKLDALMLDLSDTAFNPETHPVEKRFAAKVEELQVLVTEMLMGPPIPPKEVSLSELALLTLAAEKWARITRAQDVELSPKAQQALDATEALVARLRP